MDCSITGLANLRFRPLSHLSDASESNAIPTFKQVKSPEFGQRGCNSRFPGPVFPYACSCPYAGSLRHRSKRKTRSRKRRGRAKGTRGAKESVMSDDHPVPRTSSPAVSSGGSFVRTSPSSPPSRAPRLRWLQKGERPGCPSLCTRAVSRALAARHYLSCDSCNSWAEPPF